MNTTRRALSATVPGAGSRVRNASRRALVVGDGAAPPRRGRRRRSRARARFRGPVASPRRARGANVPSVESRARGDGRDRRHAHRRPSRRAGLAPARETPKRVANVGFPPLAATRPRPGSSRTRARVRGDPERTRTTKRRTHVSRARLEKRARENARRGGVLFRPGTRRPGGVRAADVPASNAGQRPRCARGVPPRGASRVAGLES